MREIRQYGSEGGAAGQPAVPTPIGVLPQGMQKARRWEQIATVLRGLPLIHRLTFFPPPTSAGKTGGPDRRCARVDMKGMPAFLAIQPARLHCQPSPANVQRSHHPPSSTVELDHPPAPRKNQLSRTGSQGP